MEKRLYRSRTSRVLTGVCGGLGEYWHWDPVWVRLAFVAAVFVVPPVALVGYLALWIAVPKAVGTPTVAVEAGPEVLAPAEPSLKPGWGPIVAGVLLVLVGASFFVPGGFFRFWDFGARYLGAAALAAVALGIFVDLVTRKDYRLFSTALAAILATLAVYLVFDWPGWDHWRLYFRYLANLFPTVLILGGLRLLTQRWNRPLVVAAVALVILVFVGVYSYFGGGGPFWG